MQSNITQDFAFSGALFDGFGAEIGDASIVGRADMDDMDLSNTVPTRNRGFDPSRPEFLDDEGIHLDPSHRHRTDFDALSTHLDSVSVHDKGYQMTTDPSLDRNGNRGIEVCTKVRFAGNNSNRNRLWTVPCCRGPVSRRT